MITADADQLKAAALRPRRQPSAKSSPGLLGASIETVTEFFNDDGMTQAAALAFYTGLSLAPLLTIAVWLTQMFMGEDSKEQIIAVFQHVIGSEAASPIRHLLKPASLQAQGGMTWTGIMSILFLAVSASGVFAQLQSSLNIMWNVKADAKSGGFMTLVRKRLFSFGMLFTLLFLLLVSMMASVAINAAIHVIGGGSTLVAQVLNLAITFAVATGVFTLLFTYLPDVRVPWRDTLVGATLTSALFILGRFGLAFYLGRGGYETSYGAAVGSFVALLVWVYYTSIIIFIGVEGTQVYARRHGHRPQAEAFAVKAQRIEVTQTDPA